MQAHQVIYTSCRRGIDGANDGQQIFSHDAAFPREVLEAVRPLFGYQPPALPLGVPMSDEAARSMPLAFTYLLLPGGLCAFAQNTYLGRDYMGGAGRFGNSLSHVAVAQAARLQDWPSRYCESPALRRRMDYTEVNSEAAPAHLPPLELCANEALGLEQVRGFLAQREGRLDTLKAMVKAMLSFEREKKRLLICDVPQNIPLWIAAILYVLPARCTLGIPFTTYEYAPELSACRICGVVQQGTRYEPQNPDTHRLHYVFDLLAGQVPALDVGDEFFDMVDMAMGFSPEALTDFHEFIEEKTRYVAADESLCDGYALLALMADGPAALEDARLLRALGFAERYATEEGGTPLALALRLAEAAESLAHRPWPVLAAALGQVAQHRGHISQPMRQRLGAALAGQVLWQLAGPIGQQDFNALYAEAQRVAEGFGVRLADAVMAQPEAAGSVARADADGWKTTVLAGLAAGYARVQRLPLHALAPGETPGALLAQLVQQASAGPSRTRVCSTLLLAFGHSWDWLLEMALVLEGVLLDLPDGEEASRQMWQTAGRLLAEKHAVQHGPMMEKLMTLRRYDLTGALYTYMLGPAGADEAQALFHEQMALAQEAPAGYLAWCAEGYFKHVAGVAVPGQLAALLEWVCKTDARMPVAAPLAQRLVQLLPMAKPSPEQAEAVQAVRRYYEGPGMELPPRLAAVLYGMALEGCAGPKQLAACVQQVQVQLGEKRVQLAMLDAADREKFTRWMAAKMAALCSDAAALRLAMDPMRLEARSRAVLLAALCERYYASGDAAARHMLPLVQLLAEDGDAEGRTAVAEVLRKQGKKALEALREAVHAAFGIQGREAQAMEELYALATEKRGLLGGLFGKK